MKTDTLEKGPEALIMRRMDGTALAMGCGGLFAENDFANPGVQVLRDRRRRDGQAKHM